MLKTICRNAIDVAVTIIIWTYFLAGFVVLFAPRYIFSYFFSRNRREKFQRLNSSFYHYFFKLLVAVTPDLKIIVDEKIASLRSSIIVSNHVSYLDPLLLISRFPRQRTVVKARFFSIPIFGFVLKVAGYIPSAVEEGMNGLMADFLATAHGYFKDGGIVFIFPEGTRTRDGSIGPFNKSAFKLAKRFGVPLDIIVISGADKLYTPGKFWFNASQPITISIEYGGTIDVQDMGIVQAMEKAREYMVNKLENS